MGEGDAKREICDQSLSQALNRSRVPLRSWEELDLGFCDGFAENATNFIFASSLLFVVEDAVRFCMESEWELEVTSVLLGLHAKCQVLTSWKCWLRSGGFVWELDFAGRFV